jgi:hypothetical protein
VNAQEFIEALELPPASMVDKRVPKTLLIENGAPTAADKRAIRDGVESLRWLASLKPSNCGVPVYRDAEREYLEIAVLQLVLRGVARRARLIELVHRAVPYPVLLLTTGGVTLEVEVTVAEKRQSQAESGKVVLDEMPYGAALGGLGEHGNRDVGAALAMAAQPRADMRSLYRGWADVLTAVRAASETGRFTVSSDSADRREALDELLRLDAEVARLRGLAERERQTARLVDVNLELKRLEAARAAALQRL